MAPEYLVKWSWHTDGYTVWYWDGVTRIFGLKMWDKVPNLPTYRSRAEAEIVMRSIVLGMSVEQYLEYFRRGELL